MAYSKCLLVFKKNVSEHVHDSIWFLAAVDSLKKLSFTMLKRCWNHQPDGRHEWKLDPQQVHAIALFHQCFELPLHRLEPGTSDWNKPLVAELDWERYPRTPWFSWVQTDCLTFGKKRQWQGTCWFSIFRCGFSQYLLVYHFKRNPCGFFEGFPPAGPSYHSASQVPAAVETVTHTFVTWIVAMCGSHNMI